MAAGAIAAGGELAGGVPTGGDSPSGKLGGGASLSPAEPPSMSSPAALGSAATGVTAISMAGSAGLALAIGSLGAADSDGLPQPIKPTANTELTRASESAAPELLRTPELYTKGGYGVRSAAGNNESSPSSLARLDGLGL